MPATAIERFLSLPNIELRKPASLDDIARLEAFFEAPIPAVLRKLWLTTDGCYLGPMDANFLGPSEVREELRLEWWGYARSGGFIPFLNHESDYLAVFVREPLAYRVVYLPHDDGRSLVYRSLESCLQQLEAEIKKLARYAELDEDEIDCDDDYFHLGDQGDYGDEAVRTPEDRQTAKRLLKGPNLKNQWNFAAQLLSDEDVAEWATLLETDHFVRRDARRRMAKMKSPAIQQLLAKDQQAFDEFATLIANAARNAGLEVGERKGIGLKIAGGWWNLESLFHRRHVVNAVPRMITWIEDVTADRNPRDRADHIHGD
jgi:hypothetical protein